VRHDAALDPRRIKFKDRRFDGGDQDVLRIAQDVLPN
jgi:hypothetical protein